MGISSRALESFPHGQVIMLFRCRSDQIRSVTNSRSSLRLTSIESVMPFSHLILCLMQNKKFKQKKIFFNPEEKGLRHRHTGHFLKPLPCSGVCWPPSPTLWPLTLILALLEEDGLPISTACWSGGSSSPPALTPGTPLFNRSQQIFLLQQALLTCGGI